MLDQVFVYHPSPWVDRNWQEASGLPLEDVYLPLTPDISLFAWFVDAGPTRPVVLWCHGNAGNIIHRLDNLAGLYRRHLSVLIFDYRGYGRSTGTPNEGGLYADGLAYYDYLVTQRRVAPERLVVFGRSLGAAVAAEITKQRPAAGLILESAFPSIQAMADQHYWGIPSRWVVEARFDLLGKLARLTLPKLIIHGERDTIVPLSLGRQVYHAAPPPKAWYLVRKAGHNDVPIVGGPPYYERFVSFATEVAR